MWNDTDEKYRDAYIGLLIFAGFKDRTLRWLVVWDASAEYFPDCSVI